MKLTSLKPRFVAAGDFLCNFYIETEIDHFVMAITAAEAEIWQTPIRILPPK